MPLTDPPEHKEACMNAVSRFAFTAVIASVLLSGAGSHAAWAQEGQARQPQINVSGEGEVSLAPDMAILTLAVLREAETADAALSANNVALQDVLQALQEQGITERDIQTSQFQIIPRYSRSETKEGMTEDGKIIGYAVSNGLTVRVRDLAKLGALLDQSVKLGVNKGGEISFTNDDPEAALTQARKQAVARAVDKAKTLTQAAGVKLGHIIEINENSMRPMPQPMMRMAMAKDMAAEAVPVASGENTYTVTVNVSFALQQ
jgi:uncharacterized protein YggE